MEKILGKHKLDFNEIRRLCLLCHGLDLTSSHIFTRSTYNRASESTKEVMDRLFTSLLLNLAVAIRINLYQKKIQDCVVPFESTAASIYWDSELLYKPVTIKEVCDKIIHAETIEKPVFPNNLIESDVRITFQLKGNYKDRRWTMDLSLELFTEEMLSILDKIESIAG